MPHPDLDSEQAHIDRAYACLDAMRVVTARLIEGEYGATEVDSAIVRAELEARLHSLGEQAQPLCFGRIDEEAAGRHYIGRRHVKDERDEPVVVDWRAPVAAPFYRATIRDSLGLRLRRRFTLDGRSLLDIFEEDFADPDSIAAGHGGVPDPLLAELGRTRSGDMRDIVATIQGEQDEIIRWPSDDLVIVQGGPGTGKTAVGLHRAAYLLYERRVEFERDGVLVVGPNPTFLEYISGVLPSLGETAVRQTTIDGLFGGRYRVTFEDPDEVARLKGDPRLAEVVGRACVAKISQPSSDLTIDVRSRRVLLDVRAVRDALEKSLAGVRTLKLGRELFTERLQRMAFRAFAERHDPSVDEADFLQELRSTGSLTAARNQLWPSINPAQVVRELLSGGPLLQSAAADILNEDEVRVLGSGRRRRSGCGPWARGDLPLLDEAEARVAGPSFIYGHVIVDEAQDLSPMEARMIGRRALEGSMTVLGDLAQATGLVAQTDWREMIRHLDTESEPKTFQLTVGYRVPRPIMEFANRLLPAAAPHVVATESIRFDSTEPRLVAVEAADLMQRVWDEAVALAETWVTVGMIAPRSLRDQAIKRFSELDPDGVTWREGHLDAGLTLLSPAVAKGLEFDAVVIVEPQRISREELHGHRMLYVALTRAVQELTVIHAEPLPELLAALQPP